MNIKCFLASEHLSGLFLLMPVLFCINPCLRHRTRADVWEMLCAFVV